MLVWEKTKVARVSRLVIAGDFLPAGDLQLPPGRDWSDIATGVSRRFAKSDITLMNLECCLDVGQAQPTTKIGPGDSFAAGLEALEFFSHPGTMVVGLANNHVSDFGQEGVERTRAALSNRGMIPLGVGRSLQDPPETCVIETAGGPRIGIWAAARHLPELATYKKPGVEPATRRRAQEAIKQLEAQAADLTVAFLHAGLEHTNRPDPEDVAFMDVLAGLGFDIVTACHSHRISGHRRIERKSGSPAFCFYGLGSITSGVIYSDLEREGLVVAIDVAPSGEIVRVEVHPIHLEDTGWGRIPLFGDACTILQRFVDLSEELETGAYRSAFYRDLKGGLSQSFLRNVQVAMRRGGIRGLATKIGRIRMRHLNRLLYSSLN
jgi:poly-gamma-glutamate capsule biosynthesis protein CapA/YwtB (metallophosphatase superfamily)